MSVQYFLRKFPDLLQKDRNREQRFLRESAAARTKEHPGLAK
jgi:hypothetical protein